MNEQDLLNEPSILRCTWKKATSVFTKHMLYAAYAIDIIAAIVIGYLGVIGILIPNVLPIIAVIVAIFFSIAWYWYAISTIPIVYFGYSLLWCVARELKEEDWKSKEARDVALALATLTFALALALALAFAPAFAFALALALALTLATLDDHKSMLFIGAYLHYRKRTRKP